MPHGHRAKTVVRNADLREVLMVLRAGARIPSHHADGSMVLHVLDGRVVVTLLESSFDLVASNVLTIGAEIEHALVAIEDTALMLTVGHPA